MYFLIELEIAQAGICARYHSGSLETVEIYLVEVSAACSPDKDFVSPDRAALWMEKVACLPHDMVKRSSSRQCNVNPGNVTLAISILAIDCSTAAVPLALAYIRFT